MGTGRGLGDYDKWPPTVYGTVASTACGQRWSLQGHRRALPWADLAVCLILLDHYVGSGGS